MKLKTIRLAAYLLLSTATTYMHNFQKLISRSIAVFVFTGYSLSSFGQCGNNNTFASAATSIPCGTDGRIDLGAGTYATFPVVSNATYIFRTCGSANLTGHSFDTQITGFNGASTTVAFYNDDNGGTCTNCVSSTCNDAGSAIGESYAQWTSNFTGTLRVNVDLFNCNDCLTTNCPGLGLVALRYNQVSNLVFTSSSADLCSGSAVSLSATPTGGSFSGTGVSGVNFLAPATAGAYTITYTLGSCSVTQTINVLSASATPTFINATRTSYCDGPDNTDTLKVVGGTLGSSASWKWYSGSCGGTPVGTGNVITLIPGVGTTNYFVRAEGACNNTACVTTAVELKSLSVNPASINVSSGCDSGSVLNVVGGSLGTNAAWHWYSGATCCGTTAGSGTSITVNPHTLTFYYVTGEGDCNSTNYVSAAADEHLVLAASATSDDVTCHGGATGDANLAVSGGVTPYSFSWSNAATTQNISGLTADTYSVTVLDANSCSAIASTVVNEPVVLAASATPVDVSCNAGANGQVSLTVSGGVTPYSFSWSNSATTQNITGLTADTYSVTVLDANSCTAIASTIVNEPVVLAASATPVDVSCNGGANGQVNLSVSGGVTPYSFSWSNAATTQNITGLAADTYSVIVLDANSCTAIASTIVNEPAVLAALDTALDVSCNGGTNGQVNLTVSGGVTPYSFSWSNATTTQNITGLTADTYSVTVLDANSCSTIASTVVNEPVVLAALDTALDVSCNGGANGTVNLTVSGGVIPYSFLWSNADTTQNITGLTAGTYSVTVNDANGCSDSASTTVPEPELLVVSGTITNATGANNGAINLTATGGTTAYAYSWSNSDTTEDISGLISGVYTVTVTDANSCTATATFTIISTGISVTDQIAQFNLLPNPASNSVVIQISLNEMSNLNLQLVDVTGKVILFKQMENIQTYSTSLNLAAFSSGVYLVRLSNDKLNLTHRLVIEK